jgi:hypothetical protein
VAAAGGAAASGASPFCAVALRGSGGAFSFFAAFGFVAIPRI